MVLTNQPIYLVNAKTCGRFFQIMCAYQKVPTLKKMKYDFNFALAPCMQKKKNQKKMS